MITYVAIGLALLLITVRRTEVSFIQYAWEQPSEKRYALLKSKTPEEKQELVVVRWYVLYWLRISIRITEVTRGPSI